LLLAGIERKLCDSVLSANSAYSAGFDCVVAGLAMKPERLFYARLPPLESFGYQIITTRPSTVAVTFSDRAWKWTLPFSKNSWLIWAFSLVASGLINASFTSAYFWKDRRSGGHRSGTLTAEGHLWGQTMTVFEKSVSALSGMLVVDKYEADNLPSKIYSASAAFSGYILLAYYLANLATILITAPTTSQPIKSIDSFVETGLQMCVKSNTAVLGWIAASYPALWSSGLVKVIGTSTMDNLQNLLDGECAGILALSSDALFDMSPNVDSNGLFCNLMPVGPVLGFNLNALPFTANASVLSDDAFKAVSFFIAEAIFMGNWTAGAELNYFTPDSARTQCSAAVAANNAATAAALLGRLEPQDFAGLWIIQAIGLAVASIVAVIQLSLPIRRSSAEPASDMKEESRQRATRGQTVVEQAMPATDSERAVLGTTLPTYYG